MIKYIKHFQSSHYFVLNKFHYSNTKLGQFFWQHICLMLMFPNKQSISFEIFSIKVRIQEMESQNLQYFCKYSKRLCWALFYLIIKNNNLFLFVSNSLLNECQTSASSMAHLMVLKLYFVNTLKINLTSALFKQIKKACF